MTLTQIHPPAVMPGGEVRLTGTGLGPGLKATIAGVPALVQLARESEARVLVPDDARAGDLQCVGPNGESAYAPLHIAALLSENLHPVANPAADAAGNIYTTLSGARGQQLPVSIFRLTPSVEVSRGGAQSYDLEPFVRDLLNPTGLAFGPDGLLYCSSRAEGTIYRIDAEGQMETLAEGLGIATGIAFDAAGDLYVGDRSGTIFKIRMSPSSPAAEGVPDQPHETFVFATLEPSIAAYHLAFDSRGTLYVTGPTTSSSQVIHAIDRDGAARVFYRGLGRAQGLAFDRADNLFVVASLAGDRGLIRITPNGEATLALSGANLIGLCFLPNGHAALATRDSIYTVNLGIPGRLLYPAQT